MDNDSEDSEKDEGEEDWCRQGWHSETGSQIIDQIIKASNITQCLPPSYTKNLYNKRAAYRQFQHFILGIFIRSFCQSQTKLWTSFQNLQNVNVS